ncbi:MAG: hypothetical protein ABI237_12070 [Ginsengibacter sp.]
MLTLLSLISSAIGGGVFVYLLELARKTGKLKLNDINIKLYYLCFENQTINNIKIELQFINLSGYQRIIKDFKIRFYDGENNFPLRFENNNINPADIIPAKEVKTLKYNAKPYGIIIELPPSPDSIKLEISYTINKKTKILQVDKSKIQMHRIQTDAEY